MVRLVLAILALAVVVTNMSHQQFMPIVINNSTHIHKGLSTPVQFGAERCSDVVGVNATWHYNWDVDLLDCPGEDVPMIWGRKALQGLESGRLTLGGDSKWVMGYNEPDLESQANVTPLQAARDWHKIEQMYPDRWLVAPAPSHFGYEWIARMRQAYIAEYGKAPRFDALAMHSYLSTTNMREVLEWMDSKAAAWGVPEIWLTEWGLPPPFGTVYSASIAYMRQCREMFNEYDRLTRFAWFTSRSAYYDKMCCWSWGTNDLTPIGVAYKEL